MANPASTPRNFAARMPERLAGWSLQRASEESPAAYAGALFAGRYMLTRKIGGGGMSTIYEARDSTLGVRVVVKIMRGDLPTDHVDRFRREAHILAGLQHEHLARIIDRQDPEEGPRFHVTDYIDGLDLGQLRRRSPVPAAVVLQIGLQVAAALAYAHAAGVIHRDIKPSNLMLVRHPGGDVFAKVIDFGIAKLVRGSELAAPGNAPPGARRETQGDVVVGTAPYWSSHEGSRRDVYALALTLAELLTGEDPDPTVDLARPTIPPVLAQVLSSALRSDDIKTMDDFHAALHEADVQPLSLAEAERRRYVAEVFAADSPRSSGEPTSSDAAPRFAGRYLLIRELGHGGMGRVQLVFDTEHRRMVALKTIQPRHAKSKNLQHRFRRELHALAALQSGAPVLYESGTEPEPYFTMEIVEGVSLTTVLKASNKLEPLRALELAIQLGKILRLAHDVGVIHRDVKPDNIMIDAADRVRLIDFGACLLMPRFHQRHPIYPGTPPEKRYTTGELECVGTPGYTAPEILEISGGAGPRSDIYSVCAVLYEMLTGRPLVDRSTGHRASLEPGEFSTSLGPVADLLRRGTAHDPSDRVSSMSDLVRCLEILRASLLGRRQRQRLVLAAAAAFLSAVALMLALRLAAPSDPPAAVETVVMPPEALSPAKTPEAARDAPSTFASAVAPTVPPGVDVDAVEPLAAPVINAQEWAPTAKGQTKSIQSVLSQASVARTIARRRERLQACDAPYLILSLTIAAGRAKLATVNGMSAGDALHSCVSEKLRGLSFPRLPDPSELEFSLDLRETDSPQ